MKGTIEKLSYNATCLEILPDKTLFIQIRPFRVHSEINRSTADVDWKPLVSRSHFFK